MGITIIVKKNRERSGRSVSFESRPVPGARMGNPRSNVSGRHMSVVVPAVEGMEPSELKEHAHYLREKLQRDDITEDSIAAKVEVSRAPKPKSAKQMLKEHLERKGR